MKPRTEKRKITVQLWKPLKAKLGQICESAGLNRDAYLDLVFAHEALQLRADLDGNRNSPKARAFIKKCFAELRELEPVTFALSAKTADALTDACDSANVWRDVFVNRVIYFLVAKSSSIESQYDFKFRDHRRALSEEGEDAEALVVEPRLVAIRDLVAADPFLSIRIALRSAYPDSGGRLHCLPLGAPYESTPISRGLAGFSAYLPDEMVPGTPASEESKALSALI